MVPRSSLSPRSALLLLLLAACGGRGVPVSHPGPASGPDAESAETSAIPSPAASGEPTAALDDGAVAEPSTTGATLPHPLDGWSEDRIERAVSTDLASLGPMSVGSPNAGGLVNGVQAAASPLYSLVSPGSSWGTRETIDYLDTAIRAVHEQFPGTAPLALGDIGARHGGPLRPHISHQAGRDLDLSFYYRDGGRWYARGTKDNLDWPRLWALVRALIEKTDIDLILLDHGLQIPLEEYAQSIGEDQDWLDSVFRGKNGQRPIIRHAPGHATHLHLRFWSPTAQETARRCYASLARHHLVKAPEQFVSHKAKKNETLAMIAKKYGSSVRAIREANGLRSTRILEKAVYRVPVTGGGVRVPPLARVRVPPRRIPPPRRAPAALLSASAREQEQPTARGRQR